MTDAPPERLPRRPFRTHCALPGQARISAPRCSRLTEPNQNIYCSGRAHVLMAAGRGLCGRYKLRLEQGMCLLCRLHKLQRLAKEPPVLERHSAPWLCATCTRDLHHRATAAPCNFPIHVCSNLC